MLCFLAFIPPPLPSSPPEQSFNCLLSGAERLQSGFSETFMRHEVISGAGLDWWKGNCIAPVWQAGGRGAKLSRMQHRGDQQTAERTLQSHPFIIHISRPHLHRRSSFTPLPREEGGGRIAELLLCGGYPSWTAQEPPGGDAAVQRRWAGRCAATGTGIAEWWRPRPLSSNAGSLRERRD